MVDLAQCKVDALVAKDGKVVDLVAFYVEVVDVGHEAAVGPVQEVVALGVAAEPAALVSELDGGYVFFAHRVPVARGSVEALGNDDAVVCPVQSVGGGPAMEPLRAGGGALPTRSARIPHTCEVAEVKAWIVRVHEDVAGAGVHDDDVVPPRAPVFADSQIGLFPVDAVGTRCQAGVKVMTIAGVM